MLAKGSVPLVLLKYLKNVHVWLWMIVLLGVSLRLREFCSLRSVWLDEVALLIQIKRRSYEALLMSGVGGNQGAPAGYLLLAKLFLGHFSTVEIGARLVALASGVGAMVVSLWLVVVSFRDSSTRLVGLLLIATSPWLIYYSAEGKHYMQEVLVALLLVAASLRHEEGKMSLRLFGLLGVVAVWFSHNAPVVLCACGTVLITKALLRGERARGLALLGISSAWVVSFALHALSTMRALFGNRALMDYWGHGLAPWRKGFPSVIAWSVDVWADLMGYIFIPASLLSAHEVSTLWWVGVWECVLGLIVALGVIRMSRERSPLVPYVSLILVICFCLSLFRLAPFSSRLVLYVVPFIILIAARGVVWLAEGVRKSGPLLTCGVTALFLCVAGPSVAISTERFIEPLDRSNMKAALRHLVVVRAPNDLLVMRRADSVVAGIYSRRDSSLSMPFLMNDWKIAKVPVMCARLRKRLSSSPDRDVWFVGALQAEEVSRAVDELKESCIDLKQRVEGTGFFAARARLRRP